MRVELHLGDCLDILPTLEENSIDTIITDPPYGLEFMGKDWDHGVPGVRFWKEIMRVAKPGAMLLAFGGTRTHHRLMVAIEDAGWEIRDCLMWLYGSGFPKSHDISKAIDKAAGAEREVVGESPHNARRPNEGDTGNSTYAKGGYKSYITAAATSAAQLWDGWGTALKPAFEPILLCRKPLTPVTFGGILSEVQNLIGGMLCLLLSNANNAEEISRLSPSVSGEASVSALMLAAVLHGAESGDLYEKMDMFSSQEMALTCLSIATLWSNILDGLLKHGSTFTTETVNEMTIALRTLRFLLSTNMPAKVIQVVSRPAGYVSSATNAARSSTSDGTNGNEQNDTFAAALAMLHTSDNGTLARNAARGLQPIIPGVVSALNHALQLSTIDEDENLVPNWEPIILAMKPRDGTFANNALKHGVAGLWVDGGRVAVEETITTGAGKGIIGNSYGWSSTERKGGRWEGSIQGRWPANLILDETVAGMLDEMTGDVGGGKYSPPKARHREAYHALRPSDGTSNAPDNYGDSGGASRFFYCAKASRSEREMGLEDFEIEGGGEYRPNDPDENTIRTRLHGRKRTGNFHPTVKPLALMRYLCRLTKTPTGGVVLDPFMGSGTTGMACVQTGRSFIGIENDPDYFAIAEKRIAEAQKQPPLEGLL